MLFNIRTKISTFSTLQAFRSWYGFRLLLYGSNVLLSTLTPNITASEPRLDTGCWLDITRLELPQLYDISLNPPKENSTPHIQCVISFGYENFDINVKIFRERTVLACLQSRNRCRSDRRSHVSRVNNWSRRCLLDRLDGECSRLLLSNPIYYPISHIYYLIYLY